MNRTFVVYEAINRVNGKRYVGATSRGLDVRRSKHLADAKSKRPGCKVFNAAIRKYGPDAFEWRIIVSLPSHEKMMEEEIRIIRETSPEYNITSGGRGIVGVKRTKEWTEKIASALRGRKLSKERVAKLRASLRPEKLFKSVTCLNDGMFFDGIVVAAKHYGVTAKQIGEVLHGRQSRCGKDNLSFTFSDKPINLDLCAEILSDLRRRRFDRASARKSRPVVCLTNGTEYKNAVSAAAINGIAPSRVMQLCKNGGETNYGLSFRYADSPAVVKRARTDSDREKQRRAVLRALKKGQIKIKKRVIVVENGKIFDSIANAARHYRLNEKNVYAHIKRGSSYSGYTFQILGSAA